MKNENTPTEGENSQKTEALAGLPDTACSAFAIYENKSRALTGLTKRELIMLLTRAGIPPQRAEDRKREVMALRLSRIVDSMTIVIKWDCIMPNVERVHHYQRERTSITRLWL